MTWILPEKTIARDPQLAAGSEHDHSEKDPATREKSTLRNGDGLGAAAFERYRKCGQVVIGIEVDEAGPGRVKLTAMTCNSFGGWPDPEVSQRVLSCDPEREVVIRFTDNGGRVRTERLRAGPGVGNAPKKAHKIGLLGDTLRSVRIERNMAPFG
jgi:hypothetical protein